MKEIRIEKIMNILKQKGFASVDELSRAIGVSKITVRRYLSFLENYGLIERKRGGAILKNLRYDVPFFLKLEDHKNEKIKIARAVARMIEDGSVIFATGGTTVYYAIQALEDSNVNDLTIVTNSITTAWAVINLSKPFKLLHTGGWVRQGSFECIGGHVVDFIVKMNIDLFIIGVDGVDIDSGITFANFEESVVARKVMTVSKKKIVIADDSKIGKVAPYRIAAFDEIDVLITNATSHTRTLLKEVTARPQVILV